MSYFRTAVLLAGLTALFLGAGFMLGGEGGMAIAMMFAVGMNVFAYWNSDKAVLSMYGARRVDRRTAPEFYGLVEQLAARAGLPMPKVFIIENDQPNAFATGRNPRTPPLPRRRVCCATCRARKSRASWRTNWPMFATAIP